MNTVTKPKELNPKFIACENTISMLNSTLYTNYENLMNELRKLEMKIKISESYFGVNSKQLSIVDLLDLQEKTTSQLFEQYNTLKQKINENTMDIKLLSNMRDLLQSSGLINQVSLKTVGNGNVCTPEVITVTTSKECTISVSVSSINFFSSVELLFTMHYFVTGASWVPSYDFTVSSKGGNYILDVDTFGIVQQSTGEDWLNTVLVLGTSQEEHMYPLNHPNRKSINILEPVVHTAAFAASPRLSKHAVADTMMLSAASMGSGGVAEYAQAVPSSDIHSYGKADATFVIDHKVNITTAKGTRANPVDADNMRIFIHKSTMDVTVFSYVIPSHHGDVYYQAMGEYKSQIPYIPHVSTRLYWDGAYVGRVNPSEMHPNDKFTVPLGKNKNCEINYYSKIPQNSKEAEEKTVWMTLVGDTKSKYKVKTEEYVFSIKHKAKEGSSDKSKHLYVLSENVPISSNTDVRVDLVKPGKEDKIEDIEHTLYMTEQDLLQGIITKSLADTSQSNKIYHYNPTGNLYYIVWLNEGESFTSSIKYTVFWPSDKTITEVYG